MMVMIRMIITIMIIITMIMITTVIDYLPIFPGSPGKCVHVIVFLWSSIHSRRKKRRLTSTSSWGSIAETNTYSGFMV